MYVSLFMYFLYGAVEVRYGDETLLCMLMSRVYKYTGSATPTMCPINNARRSCVVVTLLFGFLTLFFEFVCQIYQRLRLLPGVSKFVRAGITAVNKFHLSEKISDSCEYLYLPPHISIRDSRVIFSYVCILLI